jgi:hypothetical protein
MGTPDLPPHSGSQIRFKHSLLDTLHPDLRRQIPVLSDIQRGFCDCCAPCEVAIPKVTQSCSFPDDVILANDF